MEFHLVNNPDKDKKLFKDNRNALNTLDIIDSRLERRRYCKPPENPHEGKLKEIHSDVPEGGMTHCGLAGFLSHAWAQELPVELRPDIFWYTIVSECISVILEKPDEYRHLFTESSEKTNLLIATPDPTNLPVEQVDVALNMTIKNNDFKKVITDTTFASAPSGFQTAIKLAFTYAATPYFSYLVYKCGITKVRVLGTVEEWKHLVTSIETLNKYLPSLDDYLKNAHKQMGEFVSVVFGNDKQQAAEFLSKIYTVDENCHSGHEATVNGWINNVYLPSRGPNIEKYPAHVSFMPWEDIETKKMYYKAMGLIHSSDKDGYFSPTYTGKTYEVLDRAAFEALRDNN